MIPYNFFSCNSIVPVMAAVNNVIIQNKKTIELRTWNTKIRGEFLVHAPIKIRKEAYEKLKIKEYQM